MSNHRHGWSKTALYGVWSSMWSRCRNPNDAAYENYGGRGINVCDEWSDFVVFLKDMGEPPYGFTLDRKDNNRGYSPENCRWADRKTQNMNRRGRRILRVNGKSAPLSEWASVTGISIGTLWQRLRKGWTPEQTVHTPLISQRKGIPRGEKLRDYAA
jgi:hypothetical protein